MTASSANATMMAEIIRRVRAHGVTVREMSGWRDRGRSGLFTPTAVLDHHDASTRKSGEWGALGYIMSGSSISPLSQWQVARCLDDEPKVAAIAAGRCNHAGTGGPTIGIPRNSGNRYAYGVEKANDGLGESYTAAAHEASDVLFAAILEVM